MQNLAADGRHAQTLAEMRARRDRWMKETYDHGPESEQMHDNDRKVYGGQGNPVVEKNNTLMKQWAAEAKGAEL